MRIWANQPVWRRLFLVTGVGVAMVMIALAVLRIPAVQLALLRWAVTHGEGWHLDATRISVGPGGGEVKGVRLVMPGLTAQSEPGLVVRVDPLRWLWGKRELRVVEANVNGVTLALTPAERGDETTPFTGVLTALQAPLPWSIDHARLDAAMVMTEAGATVAKGKIGIEGGGLSSAGTGSFDYGLEMTSSVVPEWPSAGVQSTGRISVQQHANHGIGRLELRGGLTFPAFRTLPVVTGDLEVTVEATAEGERYGGGLTLAKESSVRWSANFNRATGRVEGRLTYRGDSRLVAPLFKVPPGVNGEVSGTVDFSVHPDTGAMTLTVDARGRVPDLQPMAPDWIEAGAWVGRLRATATRETARSPWSMVSSRLTIGPELQAEAVVVEGQGTESARVRLQAFPLDGLTTGLRRWGLSLAGGRAAGAWQVTWDSQRHVVVSTLTPLTVGPMRVEAGGKTDLPPVSLALDLAAQGTPERLEWEVRNLRISAGGVASSSCIDVAARGEWKGTGGGRVEKALMRWRATSAPPEAADFLSLRLVNPLDLSAEGQPRWRAGQELFQLEANEAPLSEFAPWLGEWSVMGKWRRGASLVTVADPQGGLALRTPVPWQFSGLEFGRRGEAPLWSGTFQVTPHLERHGDRWSGRCSDLAVRDSLGRVVTGTLAGAWAEGDGAYQVNLGLASTWPAGTLGPPAWGEMTVDLTLKAGLAAETVHAIETIEVVVRDAHGERARLMGAQPLLGARRPTGEWLLSSVAPWKLKIGTLPLGTLADFLPAGWRVEGELGSAEFLVSAVRDGFRFRPLQPLAVSRLNVAHSGTAVVQNADASFFPGIDLTVHYLMQPRLQVGWEASLQATEGRVRSATGELLQFEAAVGVVGDDRTALVRRVDAVARGDLSEARAVLPSWQPHLPSAGRFTARLDGGLLAGEFLDAWMRIEDVPERGGTRRLAPLEITARGKVDGARRTAEASVELRLGEEPAVSDLKFDVHFGLERESLRITSALRGKRWDMNETLAWSRAWGEPVAAASTSPGGSTPAANPVRTALGSAIWGALRGSFDLDLEEVAWTPYRIEGVRARVDLEERRLSLSGLGGRLFAGTIEGALTIDYVPGDEDGDHRLKGALQLHQFETARVAQTVFPKELGSLDARVDLHSEVKGQGNRLWELLERAEVDFGVEGKGTVRLTSPDARTASTLLVMGGLVTLSPELRALGRLLRKFAEMPVDRLLIEGGRDATGAIRLSKVWFDSPQARLVGTGDVPATSSPLAARPLDLRFDLSARDEVGLILGRMRLLESPVDAQGFRRLNQSIVVGGNVGRPDSSALYDLLARGVEGSRGTWGFIMRKVQREVERQQAQAAKAKGKAP